MRRSKKLSAAKSKASPSKPDDLPDNISHGDKGETLMEHADQNDSQTDKGEPSALTPTLSPGTPWEKDPDEKKHEWKEITDKCLKSPLASSLAKTADLPPETQPDVPDSQTADVPPEIPLEIADSQETCVMNGECPPSPPVAKAKAAPKTRAVAKAKSKAKAKARRPRERVSAEHKARVHREGSKRWHLKWVSKGVPRKDAPKDGKKIKERKSKKNPDNTKDKPEIKERKSKKNADNTKDISEPELENEKAKQVTQPKPVTKKRPSASSASRFSGASQPAPKTSKTKQPEETTKESEQISEDRHAKNFYFLKGTRFVFNKPPSNLFQIHTLKFTMPFIYHIPRVRNMIWSHERNLLWTSLRSVPFKPPTARLTGM